VHTVVGPTQPAGQLAVEIVDVGEAPARQEARLEIAVGALDYPLGFGIPRRAQACTDAQGAAERLELTREDLAALAPLPDAAFLVPHRGARDGAELAKHLEHPSEHVVCGARRDHPRAGETTEPTHPDDDPELVGLAGPDRDLNRGLPEIELGELTRRIARALTRIRRHEQWPQLRDAIAQHPNRALPADPLRDHRRRHLWELAQQLADPWLHRVDDRALARPRIARRCVRTQGRTHRVARQAQTPRDRLDSQPLRSMKPTNLGPAVHVDHPPDLLARLEPGSEFHHCQWWTRPKEGQFSDAAKGSVFTRR
jgi:hypothetical protein